MNNDTILQKIKSNDPAVRIQAIITLKNLGLENAAELLVTMLDEQNDQIKQVIHSTITRIGKVATPYLIGALRSSNETIRNSASKILEELGDSSIDVQILNLLKSKDVTQRAIAIEILGGIKYYWAVEYIRDLLKDPAPIVRVNAARTIGNLKDKLAVDLLLPLLFDDEPGVRIAAAEALGKINDLRACEGLWHLASEDKNNTVRSTAIYSLKMIGEAIIKPYEKIFMSDDVELRMKALSDLTSIGKPAILPLIENTRSYNPSVREICIRILGSIGDELAAERLIELTSDPEPMVRTAAIHALGNIKSESALRFLISCLDNPDQIVVSSASDVLTEKGKEIIKFLPSLLAEDKTMSEQILIARLIGKIKDESVIPMLAEHLNDPRLWIRRAACSALGETKNPKAVKILIEQCLPEQQTLIRSAAVQALGKLKMTEALESVIKALQDPEESVRLAAIGALAEIGEPNTGSYILDFLSSDSLMLKIRAIKTLAELGYIGAIPHLKKMARSWPLGHESEEVKVEARNAIKKLTYETQFSRPM
jgi:HEAT repeat protein